MDPCSIAAGLIGLLDVSARLSGKARRIAHTIKNAPAQILALENELEDFRLVLNEVQQAQEQIIAARDVALPAVLSREIERAQRETDELEETVDLVTSTGKNVGIRWLRKQSHIYIHKSRLREIRQRIQELLVTHNAFV